MEELHDITAVEVVGEVGFADRKWSGVLEPLGDHAYFARVRVDPETLSSTEAELPQAGSSTSSQNSCIASPNRGSVQQASSVETVRASGKAATTSS